MQIILQAKSLSKVFPAGKEGPQHVLKSVDLSIAKGEFVSVMGPSGSGKSTLLYNISGMDSATGGNVFFDRKSILDMQEEELARLRLSRMGFIFQQHNLLKNLNLLDNIVLPAYQLKKNSRRDIDKRAAELMQLTGTSELAQRDITQASGGQLQRIAICRALINSPDILFGDEPTGALNSRSTQEVMEILEEVNHKGTTVLLVTHDAKVAARSQRVLFMVDGRLVDEKIMGEHKGAASGHEERERDLTQWLRELGF